MKITGFEELNKQLNQMKQGLEELNETKFLSFDQLFPSSFMRKYTSFSSIEELFDSGSFKVESIEDLEAIADVDLDRHIAANSRFKTWEDMQNEATTQYMAKKLGF